ncbi:MFS domain-containing protein [Lachancea thermotolerans]
MGEEEDRPGSIELDEIHSSKGESTVPSVPDTGEEEDLEKDFRDPNTFPYILLSLWLNTSICAVDGTIISTTMNEIASIFQEASKVTWVATAYMLTTCAVQPLYGKTSDLLGRKKCLLFAEVVFIVGLVMCGAARTIEELIVARAICGVGGSGLGAMCNIILSDLAPLSQRSIYWGWGSVIWGFSQSVGGPLGGLLLNWFGVRGLFVVQIPFCLFSLYLTVKYIHDLSNQRQGTWRDIDFAGSFCLITGISAFIFLCSSSGDVTDDSAVSLFKVGCFLITVLSVSGFIYVEKNVAAKSILPAEVLKGSLGVISFIYGLASMLSYVGLFVVPLYLQLVWGVSVAGSGGYIMYAVISTSIGSFGSGWLLRKYGAPDKDATLLNSGMMLIGSTLINTLGFFVMFKNILEIKPAFEGVKSPSPDQKFWFLLGFAIMGLSAGFQSVSVMLYTVAKVGRKGQASSTSVTFLFRSLGNVLSVSISLSVFVASLKGKLKSYFQGQQSDLYRKLLKENAFLRSGEVPSDQLKDLLQVSCL